MTSPGIPLLDQLDALRAAATPAPWKQHPADGEYVIGAWISDDEYLDVADTFGFRENRGNGDAALIVAAVNALPQLTAALRAVHELADKLADPPGLRTPNGEVALLIRAALDGGR